MSELNRQQELVLAIAEYLTTCPKNTESEDYTMDLEESIEIIELFGIKFSEPCDGLVVNAIRNVIWTSNSCSEILSDVLAHIGFTEEEIKKYI